MKKYLIATILLLALLLTACGSNGTATDDSDAAVPNEDAITEEAATETVTEAAISKDELLGSATEISSSDFVNSFLDNTTADYLNTPISTAMWVQGVENDHAVLSGTVEAQFCIDAYMPPEDLAAIKVGQYIKFAGIANSIEEYSFDRPNKEGGILSPHMIMPTAYLIEVAETAEDFEFHE